LAAESLRTLGREARKAAEKIKRSREGLEIFGPALAEIKKIRGLNRVQIIVKASSRKSLDSALSGVLDEVKVRKKIIIYE